MLDFLIVVDNIFVLFGRLVFQQRIGIPMGTNCVPLRYIIRVVGTSFTRECNTLITFFVKFSLSGAYWNE
jgi:hypothetical protein